MPFYRFIIKYLFLVLCLGFFGCQGTSDQKQTHLPTENPAAKVSRVAIEPDDLTDNRSNDTIPKKVYKVLSYIRQNNKAPEGYVGGRKFGNFEKRLPLKDEDSRPAKYQEWDVNPKKKGKNRGPERLVTTKKRAWYTRDHYNSFEEIK